MPPPVRLGGIFRKLEPGRSDSVRGVAWSLLCQGPHLLPRPALRPQPRVQPSLRFYLGLSRLTLVASGSRVRPVASKSIAPTLESPWKRLIPSRIRRSRLQSLHSHGGAFPSCMESQGPAASSFTPLEDCPTLSLRPGHFASASVIWPRSFGLGRFAPGISLRPRPYGLGHPDSAVLASAPFHVIRAGFGIARLGFGLPLARKDPQNRVAVLLARASPWTAPTFALNLLFMSTLFQVRPRTSTHK